VGFFEIRRQVWIFIRIFVGFELFQRWHLKTFLKNNAKSNDINRNKCGKVTNQSIPLSAVGKGADQAVLSIKGWKKNWAILADILTRGGGG
jgi:hypothetical protein